MCRGLLDIVLQSSSIVLQRYLAAEITSTTPRNGALLCTRRPSNVGISDFCPTPRPGFVDLYGLNVDRVEAAQLWSHSSPPRTVCAVHAHAQ